MHILGAVRLRSWLTAVWRYVRSAPLTYTWLVVLLVTTIIQRQMHGRELHVLLVQNSTNIHHLGTDPLYVLVTSLFWIDGRFWTPYLVLFSLFLIYGLSGYVVYAYKRMKGKPVSVIATSTDEPDEQGLHR